jgi:succinate dehydrogenase/fumarate reductase cytochrome b subunit
MSSADPTLERSLIRVQAASGALLAVFLLAHLFNQTLAIAGPAVYDDVQAGLRAAYQAPAVELALIAAPLLVHIVASVWRALRRRGAPAPADLRTRLQRWSAVVLLLAVFGHVAATRLPSLVYGVFPGFDGIAFTMVWAPAYFVPYYLVFSVAGLYHAAHGLSLALPRLGLGAPAARTRPLVTAVTLVGGVALAVGISGFLAAACADEGRALASPLPRLLERLDLVDLEPVPGDRR